MPAVDKDHGFRKLFRDNYEAVRAYCLRRLQAEEAADAVSEIFLIAWRRLDDIPTEDPARLWLFGVARNVVRNSERTVRRRRRAAARIGGLASVHHADPETQVVAASEHVEIMGAFHSLGAADREVLRLRLWEELSVADTAAVLGCAEKAASKRYQRALARLKKATHAEKRRSSWTDPHLVPRGGEK